ncbi:Hypothetical protein NocV09_00201810 [Nannochloropsis oceanica]
MNRLPMPPGPGSNGEDRPSKETLQKAARVRIDVMAGSMRGLGFGLIIGAGGFPIFKRYMPATWRTTKHHVFIALATSALGSFIGSATATRNSLEHVVSGMERVVPPGQRAADEAFQRRQKAMATRDQLARGGQRSGGEGFWVLPPNNSQAVGEVDARATGTPPGAEGRPSGRRSTPPSATRSF